MIALLGEKNERPSARHAAHPQIPATPSSSSKERRWNAVV
jgi:hypothetical protein